MMKKRLFFLLLAAVMMPMAMNAQPKASVHIDTTVSACNSFTWNINGNIYTYVESGAYTKIFGDTLYILDLTINPTYNIVISEQQDGGCTFTWGDSVYSTAGTHTQTFQSVYGCDSTVTINLVLSGIATKVYDVTACESYTWKDSVYSANTTVSMLDQSVANCDSALTLNLTIVAPTQKSKDDTIVACNFYTYYFNGQNIVVDEDGETISTDDIVTYQGQQMPYSWTTANLRNRYHPRTIERCFDSVYTVHFTIHDDVMTYITTKACDNYSLEASDTTYNLVHSTSNNFKIGLAANGCDSIVVLNLTVNKSPQVTIDGDLRVAPGASATLNGHCDQANAKFLWSTGSTEESITIPNVQGNVDVYLIGKNNTSGCADTSYVTVMANLDIDNADEAVMSVYPNPTSSLISINSTESVKNVTVFNTVGQQVMNVEEKNVVNLGGLSNGTYIVRIELRNGAIHTRTVILKK